MTFDDLRRPPLDRAALSAALTRPASLWRTVEVLAESPSTNAALVERAAVGAGEGTVLVAEHQTAGRGRLARRWVTPPRAALTFSFLLTPTSVPDGRWPWLPLLTGVAVVEALDRVAGVAASLKWPNDVLVADRKVAGILVERVQRGAGPAAVVGVGLNVSASRTELPVPEATSLLLEDARTVDRSVLLREVLRVFEALYLQWRSEGGDPAAGLRDSYVRRCATVGRQVRVSVPSGDPVAGTAAGVDADGRLQVISETGTHVFGAGDVVHVRSAKMDP